MSNIDSNILDLYQPEYVFGCVAKLLLTVARSIHRANNNHDDQGVIKQTSRKVFTRSELLNLTDSAARDF